MVVLNRQYSSNYGYTFVSITDATPLEQFQQFDKLIRAQEKELDRIGEDIKHTQDLIKQGQRFTRRPQCYKDLESIIDTCCRLSGIKDT